MFNGHILTGDIDMKYAKLIILLAITVSTIVGCGKVKSEPAEVPVETEVESGINEGEDTNVPEDTAEDTAEEISDNTDTNNPYADYTKNDESLEGYEVTITEVLDTQMYVIKESNILKLDQEKAGAINVAEVGAYLTVTGKTSNGWYEVQTGYLKGYLPADVLSTENPLPQEDLSQVYGDDGRTAEEILEAFEKANSSGALDDIIGPGADGMEYTGTAKEQFENSDWW